jgi:hypothetical protein
MVYDPREIHLPNPSSDPRERDPHQLSLTLLDLQQIGNQLDKAQKAGIRFTGDLVAGRHRVSVRWETGHDQRDGDWLVITGIRQV